MTGSHHEKDKPERRDNIHTMCEKEMERRGKSGVMGRKKIWVVKRGRDKDGEGRKAGK